MKKKVKKVAVKAKKTKKNAKKIVKKVVKAKKLRKSKMAQPRRNPNTLTFKITPETKVKLDRAVNLTGRSKAEIIQDALISFLSVQKVTNNENSNDGRDDCSNVICDDCDDCDDCNDDQCSL